MGHGQWQSVVRSHLKSVAKEEVGQSHAAAVMVGGDVTDQQNKASDLSRVPLFHTLID